MRRSLIGAAVAGSAALAAIATNTNAAVLYSTNGSTYSQNFDGLPNSPTNVSLGASPAGWTDDNAPAAPAAAKFRR